MPVPIKLDQARELLARANRMIANEGVLDAFGHVTMRHPTDPGRYLMSRSRGPELVQPEDIHEFTLDSQIVKPIDARLYGERVIHGEIYKARPDVNAVCHHHAPSILPFCISGMELKPVYHLGATLGAKVPFWDSRDDFGDTTLIVAKPEEGASLARALGSNWIVLMRRHGATVAGTTLRGAHLPHHLHRAQRGDADPGAQPRPCVAAQRGRDRACRRIQSAARAGGARLGILVGAARQGGRQLARAQGESRCGEETSGHSGGEKEQIEIQAIPLAKKATEYDKPKRCARNDRGRQDRLQDPVSQSANL